MNPHFDPKKKAAMLVLENAHFAILGHLVKESRILFRYNTADIIAYKAELERDDMRYEEVVILDEKNMTATIKVTPFQSIPATLRTAVHEELMRELSMSHLKKAERYPSSVCICGNRLVACDRIDLSPNMCMLERELAQNSESYLANPKEYKCTRLDKESLPTVDDFDKILNCLLAPLEEICRWLEFTINRAVIRDVGDECNDAWYEEYSLACSEDPKPLKNAEHRAFFDKISDLSDIEDTLPH